MLSGVRYLLFTPKSQGTYEVKRAYLVGSNTSSGEVQLLDLQGKQLSDQKQYGSYDYSEEDRYVEKWLYELNQGQTYVLMVLISVSSPKAISEKTERQTASARKGQRILINLFFTTFSPYTYYI